MANLIYRKVFSDWASLFALTWDQKVPEAADILRHAMVAERLHDHRKPDHFYANYLLSRFPARHPDLYGLISTTLESTADRYLTWEGGCVRIQPHRFADWQDAVPILSPMVVAVECLRTKSSMRNSTNDHVRLWAVQRTMRYTAILSPVCPAVEDEISQNGLNEMHMHLNGSTEVDRIWIEACNSPLTHYKNIRSEWQSKFTSANTPVSLRQRYDEIHPGLEPWDVYQLYRACKRVRVYLTMLMSAQNGSGVDGNIVDLCSDRPISDWDALVLADYVPPGMTGGPHEELVTEALWWWKLLDFAELNTNNREECSIGIYFLLTVHALTCRMTVQQFHEYGFDQFQKHTFVGARNKLEPALDCTSRFYQLNTTQRGDIANLEGRFAPKEDVSGIARQLQTIEVSHRRYKSGSDAERFRPLTSRSHPGASGSGQSLTAKKRGTVSAVCHFIKEVDKSNPFSDKSQPQVRYWKLRGKLAKQRRSLSTLYAKAPLVRELLHAIDGASNELHTPPEVFAPIFHAMRLAGVPHATFHVGEEYHHLASGIRAVFEALTYLNMRSGDRLGHCVALGVMPPRWRRFLGPRLMLPVLEDLDNAVFAHHHLKLIGGHAATVGRLEHLITERSLEVYGQEYSPVLLYKAWELRSLDVYTYYKYPHLFEDTDAGYLQQLWLIETRDQIIKARKTSPLAFELLLRYHSTEVRRAGAAFVEVTLKDYDDDALRALQNMVVERMNCAQVAIEALPTSNIRIGHYDDFAEYHLFRWLGFERAGYKPGEPKPTVCIGSDDPGIFASNLRNEYCHIVQTLITEYGKSQSEAARIVADLNGNGRAFQFRPAD